MIVLRHLTKQFGKRPAVEDLSLEVQRGDVFGLLGHNGAGKSTTIGMLLGQVWPTSGEALIDGHDVARNRSGALARVGAIFEAPAFYDYLSGWRNLEILANYTAPTSRERMLQVIGWVGLAGREHQTVKTYSHGMRARLALAQALLVPHCPRRLGRCRGRLRRGRLLAAGQLRVHSLVAALLSRGFCSLGLGSSSEGLGLGGVERCHGRGRCRFRCGSRFGYRSQRGGRRFSNVGGRVAAGAGTLASRTAPAGRVIFVVIG